jgi:hypothetical protein
MSYDPFKPIKYVPKKKLRRALKILYRRSRSAPPPVLKKSPNPSVKIGLMTHCLDHPDQTIPSF